MTDAIPRFSIVTISYNQQQFLCDAVESVLSQEGASFEYLIMDGGSTDGSKEIIESYASRLSYWQSCPDGGPSTALRSAVDLCKGEYLVYINSDDVLLPGALHSMANCLDRDKDIDVLYGHGISMDERDQSFTRVYSDLWGTKAYARGLVSIFQQSCALRLAAVRNAGNFNSENTTCWDGELLFQMGRTGSKFQRVDDFFGMFRIHEGSITGSQNTSDRYVQYRSELAAQVGVTKTHRGGPYSSMLKTMRDPSLMIRKACHSVMPERNVIVRGVDVKTLLAKSK